METDIDAVPWRDELVDAPPVIENGEFVLPTRPGWGVEVNEAAVRAHPPSQGVAAELTGSRIFFFEASRQVLPPLSTKTSGAVPLVHLAGCA